MKYQRGSVLVADVVGLVLLLGVLGALVYGWISNLVALFYMTTFSGQMMLRIIGAVVAPIGCIMGWL